MLNGKYDMFAPYETSAKPMFDLLGTPKPHKEQKLYDSDHFIFRNELIKETELAGPISGSGQVIWFVSS
jgi:hypothetical protein